MKGEREGGRIKGQQNFPLFQMVIEELNFERMKEREKELAIVSCRSRIQVVYHSFSATDNILVLLAYFIRVCFNNLPLFPNSIIVYLLLLLSPLSLTADFPLPSTLPYSLPLSLYMSFPLIIPSHPYCTLAQPDPLTATYIP